MLSRKNSRRIVVHEVEYRWRASGNDGWIDVVVCPAHGAGPCIRGVLGYEESGPPGPGRSSNQVVVTSRIIRRLIEYAIVTHDFDPSTKGEALGPFYLRDVIDLSDVLRAGAVYGEELETRISSVLGSEWNPLGLERPRALGEYRSYVSFIVELMRRGDVSRLANHLWKLETDCLDVARPCQKRCARVAALLLGIEE